MINGYIAGRRVLVTGGGGSIGSELCRKIAAVSPEQLIVLGRGENSIFEIATELAEESVRTQLIPVIADVRDHAKIAQVYERYRPHVVFHAAAHKHVPLMESEPDEAVKNNVFGTLNVAEIALENEVEVFVMISTDKAIKPTSVMGATKKVTEHIIQDLSCQGETKFVVVRFGNVLNTRGSIVPIFSRQIHRGGPITITHPDMKRYFMSVPEAAYLVMQSGAVAESGQTCVLDMGDPVKITDLAIHMIEQAGFKPDVEIKIQFTGLRPGEKLAEEIITSRVGMREMPWEKILLDSPAKFDPVVMKAKLARLKECVVEGKRLRILRLLQDLVPDYTPQLAVDYSKILTGL